MLSLCAFAHAQTLSDPTRPPTGYRSGGVRSAESQPLRLESVLISEDRRSAIISGEQVALGEKIGRARLVEVSESEVVLLVGGVRRTLKLFPKVHKEETAAWSDVPNNERR